MKALYMRVAYSILFYLALPLILIRLMLKAQKNPDYAKRWPERFGKVNQDIPKGVVWWHCVSVGETLASLPLIKKFQQAHPELPILVTTMTPGGSWQVKTQLKDSVFHQYVPYDLAGIMSSFIERIQPKLCVLMETEIWPNMVYYCHQKNIPLILANARMSEISANKYLRFKKFTEQILPFINVIAAQNTVDGERFIQLGYPREQLQVTGSIKFDISILPELIQKAKSLRESFGAPRSIWIAASTHPGEEEIILGAAKKIPHALLILAPRHPDRRNEVLELCKKTHLKACVRSKNELPTQNDINVFLIDTLGELLLFYAVSDIAFVGGSFIPKGGHNLLEPAALGLPVLSGESLFNFAEIEKILDNATALIKVKNADDLSEQINDLLNNSAKREIIGKAGKEAIEKNKGATDKHLALMERLLTK
jgi:3-deoxy-D-manno-octulosonic-acid transferase